MKVFTVVHGGWNILGAGILKIFCNDCTPPLSRRIRGDEKLPSWQELLRLN